MYFVMLKSCLLTDANCLIQ